MSEVQNVKTLVHEMTHAKLHSLDKTGGKGAEKSSRRKEIEAERTAYTVCQHYGIDTSDYSFGYIAGWSEGKELPELKASLDTIRQAASEIITSIDEKVQEIARDQNRVPLYEQIDRLAAGPEDRHGKTSVLQKLSEGKEKLEKNPEQSRKPREKNPER